jgi:gas vesicle protein
MGERVNDQNHFVWGFLIGGIMGALAGLFLAPKSGKELRAELKEKGSEAFEDAKEFYSEARVKAKAILDDARRRADELRKEADRQLSEARQRAKDILSGEEGGRTEADRSQKPES